VVHFDGHGVYDRQHGLGALCFEDPKDAGKLIGRASESIPADKLAKALKDYRIPLVFLEACQTAKTEEEVNASVAGQLLDKGVASVVAMSHSVLVETARRFVEAFYRSLAAGERVGAAMLRGQRALAEDTWRAKIMSAGELHLQDWFVPVLYQEEEDPQLFQELHSEAAKQLMARRRKLSLGDLPTPPPHKFHGRSRELLALERLFHGGAGYVVLRGQGGEGKTELACEAARWLVAPIASAGRPLSVWRTTPICVGCSTTWAGNCSRRIRGLLPNSRIWKKRSSQSGVPWARSEP
jgi:hypothetical protein